MSWSCFTCPFLYDVLGSGASELEALHALSCMMCLVEKTNSYMNV